MANPDHIEIIKQGVETWNAWRKENPDREPQLGRCDLSGMDLEGIDLRSCSGLGANFSGANLSGADLEKAFLGLTHFSGANLHGAKLTHANIYDADLSGADLSGARLWCTRFEASNLARANLSEAILLQTMLSRADLSGANLSRALMLQADFQGASLRHADFTGASVEEVFLEGADLTGADFSESSMRGITWRAFDLRSVRGLESVVHTGPCTLGIETLFLSQGQITERFLRGCGLAREVIAALQLTLIPSPTYDSCILYFREEDKRFAMQLHALLEARGICCWLSADDSPLESDYPGDWDAPVNKVWNKILFCASQVAVKSPTGFYVESLALQKEESQAKTAGKAQQLLMLLDLDGYVFEPGISDWQENKIAPRRAKVVADFKGWENDDERMRQGLESVLKALRTDGGREEPPKSLL